MKNGFGSLNETFAKTKCRFLVVSFSSDWLFTPEQARTIVNSLVANGKDVSFCDINSPYGHDAFLLEAQTLGSFISGFLDTVYKTEPRNQGHAQSVRVDYEVIESLIEPNSSVLDIGCGDGALLSNLMEDKNIKGEGIELDEKLVLELYKKGTSYNSAQYRGRSGKLC